MSTPETLGDVRRLAHTKACPADDCARVCSGYDDNYFDRANTTKLTASLLEDLDFQCRYCGHTVAATALLREDLEP